MQRLRIVLLGLGMFLVTCFFAVNHSVLESAENTPNAMNINPGRLFQDNMVLQRDRKVPVWGWASICRSRRIEGAWLRR